MNHFTQKNDDIMKVFPIAVQKINLALEHKDTVIPEVLVPTYFENGQLTAKSAITSVGLAAATIDSNKNKDGFPVSEAVTAFQNYGILVSASISDQKTSKSILRQVNKATKRWENNL